jgi:hypothetical protein
LAAVLPLRNPPSYLGASTQQHSARNDRLTLGTVYRPTGDATTPLAVAGGAIIGPAGTMGEVTLLSDTQIRLNPARWVIPGGTDTKQGQYVATHDQQDTIAVTAKDASLARRSYLAVVIDDSETSGVPSSGTTDRGSVQIIDGPLAASNPALPALTAYPNILLLGEFLIPSTASGTGVTWTPYNPRTGLRGAVLPVVADGSATISGHDGVLPVFDGQYRDHPNLGLQRGTVNGGWGSLVQRLPMMRIVRNGSTSFGGNTILIPYDAVDVNHSLQPSGPSVVTDNGDYFAFDKPGRRILIKRTGLYQMAVQVICTATAPELSIRPVPVSNSAGNPSYGDDGGRAWAAGGLSVTRYITAGTYVGVLLRSSGSDNPNESPAYGNWFHIIALSY